MPLEAKKNRVSDPLRLKLTDGCESPDESQELNAGSLKEHQVLSTTELSLHLLSMSLNDSIGEKSKLLFRYIDSVPIVYKLPLG